MGTTDMKHRTLAKPETELRHSNNELKIIRSRSLLLQERIAVSDAKKEGEMSDSGQPQLATR